MKKALQALEQEKKKLLEKIEFEKDFQKRFDLEKLEHGEKLKTLQQKELQYKKSIDRLNALVDVINFNMLQIQVNTLTSNAKNWIYPNLTRCTLEKSKKLKTKIKKRFLKKISLN